MKLGIGTAQFGLDYGISNRKGKTPADEVARILALAAGAGVQWLDTAHSYGTSESSLGANLWPGHTFRIVTKTPRMGRDPSKRVASLRRGFAESLERLRQQDVYGLLFHSAADLLGADGPALYAAASEFKAAGQVSKIGVSVYTAAEIDGVCERFRIDLIQVPVSILDQRLVDSGHLARLHAEGTEIHVRSAFLQGLVLMAPEVLDSRFASAKPQLQRFREVVRRAGTSPTAAALSFVLRMPEVSAVICGVNNAEQFAELLNEARTFAADDLDFREFAVQDEGVLNPTLWNAK